MTSIFDKSNDQVPFLSYMTNQHWLTQLIITSSLTYIVHLISRPSRYTSFPPTHLMFLNWLILPHLPDILKLPKGSAFTSPLNPLQIFKRPHPLQNILYIVYADEYQVFVSSVNLALENQSHIFNSLPHFAI